LNLKGKSLKEELTSDNEEEDTSDKNVTGVKAIECKLEESEK
jgi:hypothetical protein